MLKRLCNNLIESKEPVWKRSRRRVSPGDLEDYVYFTNSQTWSKFRVQATPLLASRMYDKEKPPAEHLFEGKVPGQGLEDLVQSEVPRSGPLLRFWKMSKLHVIAIAITHGSWWVWRWHELLEYAQISVLYGTYVVFIIMVCDTLGTLPGFRYVYPAGRFSNESFHGSCEGRMLPISDIESDFGLLHFVIAMRGLMFMVIPPWRTLLTLSQMWARKPQNSRRPICFQRSFKDLHDLCILPFWCKRSCNKKWPGLYGKLLGMKTMRALTRREGTMELGGTLEHKSCSWSILQRNKPFRRTLEEMSSRRVVCVLGLWWLASLNNLNDKEAFETRTLHPVPLTDCKDAHLKTTPTLGSCSMLIYRRRVRRMCAQEVTFIMLSTKSGRRLPCC